MTPYAVGLLLGCALGHAIASLLFGISPGDTSSYAGAMLLALLLILAGSLRPALEAARLDPAITMRAE